MTSTLLAYGQRSTGWKLCNCWLETMKKRGKGVLGVSEREGKAGVGDESKDVYM